MASNNVSEYRHMRTGSLTIPASNGGGHHHAHGHAHGGHHAAQHQQMPSGGAGAGAGGAPRFDGPRSPPNTSHVPCKFFRQGACQAGNACPFSHDMGNETICKYFAKGNCKFGPKCANVHILPDGRRITYGKNGVSFSTAGAAPKGSAPGGYPAPAHALTQSSSNSALTTSFMRGDGESYGGAYGYDDRDAYARTIGRQPSLENGSTTNTTTGAIPIIDTTTYTTSNNASPPFGSGSPHNNLGANGADPRSEMGLSPAIKGLSTLDAPLPASFDSNGISNAALYPAGPYPASMPNQFALSESVSSSNYLNYAANNTPNGANPSETLKLLHSSAFGSNDHLSSSAAATTPAALHQNHNNGPSNSSNSPPHGQNPHPQQGQQPSTKRNPPTGSSLLSHSLHHHRYPRGGANMSASMPKGVDRDWDSEFPFAEEDYVPENLKELLTPVEKARRGSLRTSGGPGDYGATGQSYPENAVLGSSLSNGAAGGSPIPTSSPRWGGAGAGPWNDSGEDRNASGGASTTTAATRPSRYGASPFGHVGSPLRHESMLITSDLSSTAVAPSKSVSRSSKGHGHRSSIGATSMSASDMEPVSALTQQIHRTRLSSDSLGSGGASPRLRANGGKAGSTTSSGNGGSHQSNGTARPLSVAGGPEDMALEDLEEGEFMFNMEGQDLNVGTGGGKRGDRRSGGTSFGGAAWGYSGGAMGAHRVAGGESGRSGSPAGRRESGVIGR